MLPDNAKLQTGAYYTLRNGMHIGPLQYWNPILRHVDLAAPMITKDCGSLSSLVWDVCGGSTYNEAFDIVAPLKLSTKD